jgi:transcriptional regulator of acetoin/glycerol metabolism
MNEHPILAWIRAKVDASPHLAVRPLIAVEREAIERAMILCNGDRVLAAKQLGISRATLYRKLAEGAQ